MHDKNSRPYCGHFVDYIVDHQMFTQARRCASKENKYRFSSELSYKKSLIIHAFK